MVTQTSNQKTFSVLITGEDTGRLYEGEFVAIKHLANRQHFLQDQLYRRYLGGDPSFADPDVRLRSQFLSEINAYCLSLPDWWVKSDNGLDLLDNNVLIEVYRELSKVYDEVSTERNKKVKEAAERLKAAAEKADK